MKVLVYTPAEQGKVYLDFCNSVMAFQAKAAEAGIEVTFMFIKNESLVQRGRNRACAIALTKGFDYILFIDADQGFDPEGVIKMLKLKKKVIAAPVALKTLDLEMVAWATTNGFNPHNAGVNFNTTGPIHQDDGFDITLPFRVGRIGTGLMAIHRDAIQQMKSVCDSYVEAEAMGVENLEVIDLFALTKNEDTLALLSEGYSFCEKYRSIGGDVWCAPFVHVTHSGAHEFSGNYTQFLLMKKKADEMAGRQQ